jgi:hypothetical protein
MYLIKVQSQEEYDQKALEILFGIEAYKDAQADQLANGGPGPVADYEIMVIVNEHNSEFEIEILPEEDPEVVGE